MKDKILSKRKDKDLLYFNEAVEYYNRFDKRELNFDQEIDHLNPNQLRDEMINELDNLREIISNHPDIKYQSLPEDQKQCFNEFMRTYKDKNLWKENISKAKKGKIPYIANEQTKELFRLSKMGSKNPNWRGGITSEYKRIRESALVL